MQNATFKKAANRLMQLVSAKRNTKQSTAGIGADVMTKATTADTPAKRKQAANNLAAYSQVMPGVDFLFASSKCSLGKQSYVIYLGTRKFRKRGAVC